MKVKPVECRKARTALASKGFLERKGDHSYFHFHHGGKKTSFIVKISLGAKEMLPREVRSSARNCQMAANDLVKVLVCDHDAAWVLEHFRPIIEPDRAVEPDRQH